MPLLATSRHLNSWRISDFFRWKLFFVFWLFTFLSLLTEKIAFSNEMTLDEAKKCIKDNKDNDRSIGQLPARTEETCLPALGDSFSAEDKMLYARIIYFYSSNGFKCINSVLRKVKDDDYEYCSKQKYFDCAAIVLKEALRLFPKPETPSVLYRGLCASCLPYKCAKPLCDKINTNFSKDPKLYCDDSFISTSKQQDVAERFANCSGTQKRVVMQFASSVTGPDISACTYRNDEAEILLPPGCYPASPVVNDCASCPTSK